MGKVRAKDTGPEMAVRRFLHRLGYRFRLHQSDIPGRPDIVLPRYGAVIFVHGCFWHRHRNCKRTTTPASNGQFWKEKFLANQERDRRIRSRLKRLGWRVAVVWECQTLDPRRMTNRLEGILKSFGAS
jgi:DNA mismatch endonuclease (patch repair protein)